MLRWLSFHMPLSKLRKGFKPIYHDDVGEARQSARSIFRSRPDPTALQSKIAECESLQPQVDGPMGMLLSDFDSLTPGSTSSQHSDSTLSLKSAMAMAHPDADGKKLLRMCDSVRKSLQSDKSLGSEVEKLNKLLERLLSYEVHRSPMMLDLSTIMTSHIDKLLEDLIDPSNKPSLMTDAHWAAITAAQSLQTQWGKRFGHDYHVLDQARYADIGTTGALRGMRYYLELDKFQLGWEPEKSELEPVNELEGNLRFLVGHWWLNIACAHRDGIVGSALEKPTKGRYGVAALPLLTGREDLFNINRSRYTRTGPLVSDMHTAILSQVGSQIRLLRGHCLHGQLAPSAGVRYDGLYTIRRYDFSLDETEGIYTIEVIFDRVDGQRPMELVRQIPKPSQMDEWKFFLKVEEENIRLKVGNDQYPQWKGQRETDQREIQSWRVWHRLSNAMITISSKSSEAQPRRRSSVRLEVPGPEGSKIKDPRDDLSP